MEIARTVFVCLLLSAAGTATAADQGFYFGVLGGRADYEFEQPDFFPIGGVLPGGSLTRLPITPVPPTISPFPPDVAFVGAINLRAVISPLSWPSDADHETSAWGIVAGYRIFRFAAVELNYLNLGTLKRQETLALGFPPFTSSVDIRHELETSGPSVSGLGILPVTDSWELYLRAGVLFADMEATSSIMGDSSSITFGSDSLLWGAGTQFNWGDHWSVRLDFQRFERVGEDNGVGEADIDLLSLGVIFRL
ncbi:MAG: outer membrane beta-barrel protein [Steroidobacter sp.]